LRQQRLQLFNPGISHAGTRNIAGRDRAGKPKATLAQALKVLVNSSSLSAIACTSAWVDGLETVRPSGVRAMRRARRSSKLFWMA
jgi:hypothetical protein